jgi:hypothetical protein
MTVVATTKRYVSDDRYRLRLFDAVGEEVRLVSARLHEEQFSVTPGWSDEEFRKRIPSFDEIVADLCRVEALISRWGSDAATETLTLPVKRLCDRLESGSGNSGWLETQWYPILELFYASGVAAVTVGRYTTLRALMNAPVRASGNDKRLVTAVTEGLNNRTQAFRLLPGLERHDTPCSDHLYDVLKPLLDELLFLGSEFERAFDTFEVLYAIEYATQTDRGWGPIGRFGWKGIRGDASPLLRIMKEAETAGNAWPPLTAGLCGGSIEKFKSVVRVFTEHLARNSW